MGQPWIAPDTPSETRRPSDRRVPLATASATGHRRGLKHSPVERLQPRTISSILDGGFEVMRFRFPTIAALSAIVVLPLAGVPALVAAANIGSGLDNTHNVPAAAIGVSSNARTLQLVITNLGSALALALVGVGVAHLVTGWLMGEDRSLADTLRHVLRRSWVIVIAWLVVLPLKVLGLAGCLIGVLVVLGAFLPLSAVVSAEGLGPLGSIGRCWRLARRRLALLAVLVFISIVLSSILGLVVTGIVAVVRAQVLPDASWSWVVTGALTVAFRLVFTPVQAAWATLAYLDLRVRSEGLDLELEAADLFGTVN